MELKPWSDTPYETWNISKHTATGANGIVVAQEIEAANIGKDVLLTGGNAIDAAVRPEIQNDDFSAQIR